jgi:hypothetical protein
MCICVRVRLCVYVFEICESGLKDERYVCMRNEGER